MARLLNYQLTTRLIVFVDRCLSLCPFSFDHCVICPSIYGCWLPICYLQILLIITIAFRIQKIIHE